MSSQSPQLATANRSLKTLKPPSKLDHARYFLLKHRHKSVDEIASLHGVSVLAVQHSIEHVELYRDMMSDSSISLMLNSMLVQHVEKAAEALGGALVAEHVVTRVDADGNSVEVSRSPDHKTRLSAIDRFQKFADRNIQKGAGVQVNVQQNSGAGGVSDTPTRALSFEEIIRQRRAARGLTNGDTTTEADYEEVDESADEDEENDENED